MRYIADFHIHSKYSRATSSQLSLEQIEYWGKKKGITIVGTGDAVHPEWFKELKSKLVPAESGLYTLKNQNILPESKKIANEIDVRFIITAEISCIYKKGGKCRKVHSLILAPSLSSIEKIAKKLGKIGNISSDGRPILGLDSKNLLDIVLNADEQACIIPAHIWTPWFSVLGSKSGFDDIEECYGDLTRHIFAVETGLSSDPPMNWQCSFLDKYSLVSNSDAHSPENLGREANIFNGELTYDFMLSALKKVNDGFIGTIEYFPEEGKYHLDGHRKCDICWTPEETKKHNGICPVCGKTVTIGVYNRVKELAAKSITRSTLDMKEFYSLTSLKKILSEMYKSGPTSKKISNVYETLVQRCGSEFSILMDKSIDELNTIDSKLAQYIDKLRKKNVIISAGYDGVFGSVKIVD